MTKYIAKSIGIIVILLSTNLVLSNAQTVEGKDYFLSSLKKSHQRKIGKAFKREQKANKILEKAYEYQMKIDDLESRDRPKKRKIRKLTKKKMERELKAQIYIREAYKTRYKIYSKNLQVCLKNPDILKQHRDKGIKLITDAKADYKQAKKLRRKGKNKASVEKSHELIMQAYDLERKLLANQELALNYLFAGDMPEFNENIAEVEEEVIEEPVVEEPEPIVEEEPVVTEPEPEPVVEEEPVVVEPEPTPEPEPVIAQPVVVETPKPVEVPKAKIVAPKEGLYYAVQIMATTRKVRDNEVDKYYQGSEELQLTEEGGWYKYSIGEFKQYEDAKQYKKDNNLTKAFVVAFYNGKKISVKEALRLQRQ